MKRLVPLLIALALPTVLFAQNQAGNETRNREWTGIDNGQDSQPMDSPDNTANKDWGQSRPGADLQNSRDGSRDQPRQTLGDDNSRRHFRYGADTRRFRDRIRRWDLGNRRSHRDGRYPRYDDQGQ